MSNVIKKRTEAELPDTLSEKGKHKVEKYGWPYFKAGIILTNGRGEFLLVKEAKEQQLQENGKKEWVPTENGKWNLPCGRLRKWEDFDMAASREGSEESGYDFDMGCIRHIGFRFDIDNPYIIVIYHADHPYDISATDPPNPEEIAEVGWFNYQEVLDLHATGQLRNPELTLSAVHNERANVIIPEEAITVYNSKFAEGE